jgi:hypothetical protein
VILERERKKGHKLKVFVCSEGGKGEGGGDELSCTAFTRFRFI